MSNSIEARGTVYTINATTLDIAHEGNPMDQIGGLGKGLIKFARVADKINHFGATNMQLPEGGASSQIRLDTITAVSVGFTAPTDKGMLRMAKLGGVKGEMSTVGKIRVTTTGSGPHGQILIDVMEGKKEEASAFVDALRAAVDNVSRAQAPQVAPSGSEAASGPTKVCPDCAEDIKLASRKCRY
jgi:hypothetical protein